MNIKYVVEGKEFTTEAQAKAYINKKQLENTRFKINDTVYHLAKDGLLHKHRISNVCNQFGKVFYEFADIKSCNEPVGSYSDKLYSSVEEYIEYIKSNIK